MALRSTDTPALRKARGAFFTPKPIADYLADWAVEDDPSATILDPTCGESVFLESAGARLRDLGATPAELRQQILGVDLHQHSIRQSKRLLRSSGLDGTFIAEDFFALSTPDKLDARLPQVDAVIGNPPFVRYQEHAGLGRKRAQRAAMEQGVRISGLASSWAALLVHACGFLKPEGRLAMVLPVELLSVGYAEPVRQWLKRRFKAVHLVMFERLQFEGAQERVVLVLARGSGGCRGFSLVPVADADDLPNIRMFGPMHLTVAPSNEQKWTDFLLPVEQRQLFDRVVQTSFVPLSQYGTPRLGTVTGANNFFCLDESTRHSYAIPEQHLTRICPPGTKHLPGSQFTQEDWNGLREREEATWLLHPRVESPTWTKELAAYLEVGKRKGVPAAYKCQVRKLWFRPPLVPVPDFFFTYMAHWAPRLIENAAGVAFVNSMHGVTLQDQAADHVRPALPLLALNSATMLGGELFGRAYGGGILKMEPREAASLPVPSEEVLAKAWKLISGDKTELDAALRAGHWPEVVKRVDEAVLGRGAGLSVESVARLAHAAASLRAGRMGSPTPGQLAVEGSRPAVSVHGSL